MSKVKLGLVGLNFGLRLMAEQLRHGGAAEPYFEIGAVCDINEQVASHAAQTYRAKAYTSLTTMLEDPSVEAVALFTGPVGRASLIRQIIRSGRDVITTKPFEIDPGEALGVLEEAHKLGRTIHLNSPTPLPTRDIAQMLEWQKSHGLGRPVMAHWHMWCNYREEPDGTWYDDPELCPAAPLLRLGIYAINDLLWFLKDPESVQVMHSRIFTKRPTADNAQMLIRFRDGTLASVSASFCVGGGRQYPDSLVINFERGTAYRTFDGPTAGLRLCAGPQESLIDENTDLDRSTCSSIYMWDEFHRAVRGRRSAGEVPAQQIADGIRIIDAMRRAQNGNMAHIEAI
jgi:predicted dehydrogenase